MKNKFALTGLMSVLVLSGCAATSSAPKSGASPTVASGAVASAPAAPATTPVRVPAESARKVVLNMSGAKTSIEAKDWASFKEEWRATFAEHAKDAGISSSIQNGDARPIGEDGTLLTVHVNDYRQVGIGARIFLGVMSGNAYIDAKVA